jgi:hypothetical protein
MSYKLGNVIIINKHGKKVLAVVLEEFFDAIICQKAIEDSITKKVYILDKEYIEKKYTTFFNLENLDKNSTLYKRLKTHINFIKLKES